MQKTVGAMGVAKPGQILKGLHSSFLPFSAVTKDTSVRIGCFVQADGKFIKGASGNQITGKIVGIAIASEYFSGVENSDAYPANVNATFAYQGCIAMVSDKQANVGQYVFLKNDDGSLVFNDTKTKAEHTFTGFRVVYGTNGSVTEPQIIGVEGKVD